MRPKSKIAYRERSHARGIGAKLHQRERVHPVDHGHATVQLPVDNAPYPGSAKWRFRRIVVVLHRDSEAETVEQREERLRVRRIKDGARRAAQTV